jgi:two-component system response regulator WspF
MNNHGSMRIAIVNDLRLAVESLRRSVATIPGATIAWIAYDGAEAVALCANDRPDVLLMDMIMPVMDGVEATRRIMRDTPCPIIVVTATVEGNSSKVFEALGAGALDAVATPTFAPDLSVVGADPLVRKIRTVEALTSGAHRAAAAVSTPASSTSTTKIPAFVAIGASTGGPQALLTVLSSLPAPAPWPIVVVQHVDPTFAPGMTEWLARETRHRVEIVREDDALAPGRVALAATNDHLLLDQRGRLHYSAEPREAVFRPSVDAFFDSIRAA